MHEIFNFMYNKAAQLLKDKLRKLLSLFINELIFKQRERKRYRFWFTYVS